MQFNFSFLLLIFMCVIESRFQRKSTALFLKLIDIFSCFLFNRAYGNFGQKVCFVRTINCATHNSKQGDSISIFTHQRWRFEFKFQEYECGSCVVWISSKHRLVMQMRSTRQAKEIGEQENLLLLKRKISTFHIKTHTHINKYQGQIIEWHSVCMWFKHWIENDKDNIHLIQSE